MDLTLNANIREGIGKQKVIKLRQNGAIPAVLYGEGKPTQHLTVSAYDLNRVLVKGGISKLISLTVSDGQTKQNEHVLVKELQRHPSKGHLLHLDLMRVAMDHPVSVKVGVHVINEEKRIKDGAVIELLLHELEISCLPNNIPERINIDVHNLTLGNGIHVKDLNLPQGIKALSPLEEMVVLAAAPHGAATPETAEAGEAPAVVSAKKEE